ncbi:hypothetical protein AVEN_241134-1 [Araneus ventricosus]|uniref:Uncharacterized protein n=1 Tax=Araneus ventricosus TaxID=182803 RepID=A0A4Y2JB87_ARAVE|nr:hypothetical protein AVEN_241134-1 [Araneus ventricosus]
MKRNGECLYFQGVVSKTCATQVNCNRTRMVCETRREFVADCVRTGRTLCMPVFKGIRMICDDGTQNSERIRTHGRIDSLPEDGFRRTFGRNPQLWFKYRNTEFHLSSSIQFLVILFTDKSAERDKYKNRFLRFKDIQNKEIHRNLELQLLLIAILSTSTLRIREAKNKEIISISSIRARLRWPSGKMSISELKGSEPDSIDADPPILDKIHRVLGLLNPKSYVRVKHPPSGVVRNLERGCQLSPRHLISVQNYEVRPKLALLLLRKRDANITELNFC